MGWSSGSRRATRPPSSWQRKPPGAAASRGPAYPARALDTAPAVHRGGAPRGRAAWLGGPSLSHRLRRPTAGPDQGRDGRSVSGPPCAVRGPAGRRRAPARSRMPIPTLPRATPIARAHRDPGRDSQAAALVVRASRSVIGPPSSGCSPVPSRAHGGRRTLALRSATPLDPACGTCRFGRGRPPPHAAIGARPGCRMLSAAAAAPPDGERRGDPGMDLYATKGAINARLTPLVGTRLAAAGVTRMRSRSPPSRSPSPAGCSSSSRARRSSPARPGAACWWCRGSCSTCSMATSRPTGAHPPPRRALQRGRRPARRHRVPGARRVPARRRHGASSSGGVAGGPRLPSSASRAGRGGEHLYRGILSKPGRMVLLAVWSLGIGRGRGRAPWGGIRAVAARRDGLDGRRACGRRRAPASSSGA